MGSKESRTHRLVQITKEVDEEHGGVAAEGERVGGVEDDGGLVHDCGDDAVVVDAVCGVVHPADVVFWIVTLGVCGQCVNESVGVDSKKGGVRYY